MAGVVLDQAYLPFPDLVQVSAVFVSGQRLNRWTPKHLESGSTLRHPSMMHVTKSN